MTTISSLNLMQPVSYQRPVRNIGVGNNVAFQGSTEKTEKNRHKFLKALVIAGITIGSYLLLKKYGKEIGSKTKEVIDTLGQKAKEVIEGIKDSKTVVNQGTKTAAEEAKAAAEAINKPFTTSAEQINKNLGIKDAVKSATDSAAVFEANGLTEVEKSLNGAETMTESQIVSQVKKQPKSPEDIIPSRREIIREQSSLNPGQKIQGKGKTYSRKARHNERQIIEQLMNQA